jgi:methylated-DNA-[protein]-cysteine S-methyltransferase
MTTLTLTSHCSVDTDRLGRLRARLARDAQASGLLDIAYHTVDSVIGTLLLAASPLGLLRVAFANEDYDQVLQNLSQRISPRLLQAPARLDPVARQLDEYFTHRRQTFDLPLDWSLASGFRREVLAHLATDIGYGATTSYAGLARLSGSPKSVRSVGTACATNPIPIVVPCHRVIQSSGAVGAYRGGTAAKRTLLGLEQER